jgi:hypothetical protein
MSEPSYEGILADLSKLAEPDRTLAIKALMVIATCESAIPSIYGLEDPKPVGAALEAAIDLADAVASRVEQLGGGL